MYMKLMISEIDKKNAINNNYILVLIYVLNFGLIHTSNVGKICLDTHVSFSFILTHVLYDLSVPI